MSLPRFRAANSRGDTFSSCSHFRDKIRTNDIDFMCGIHMVERHINSLVQVKRL